MTTEFNPKPANGCCGCSVPDASRRASMRTMAGALLTATAAGNVFADDDAPRKGDLFIEEADKPTPLKSSDLKVGEKQLIALPYDPVAKRARDGSRLSRVILVKLDPASMDAATKAIAADGVLGFSAVCTHQGCDVNSWRAAEKTFLCFCHFSQFNPLDHGTVVAGPAPRPLPSIPLAIDNGNIVAAGGFSAPAGSGG